MCTHIAYQTGAIVLDVRYSKAPEHPFPTAFNDVVDVLAFLLARPEAFDGDRITLGGYSAGGGIALAVAAAWPGVVKAVIAHYPVVRLQSFAAPVRGVRPLPRGAPGLALPRAMRKLFKAAYVPSGADLSDPRLTPLSAPTDAFPPTTIIVRCIHRARTSVHQVF